MTKTSNSLDIRRTSPGLAEQRPTTVVIPISSVEQHGLHLPLCTDFAIANAMAPSVASALGAYCLPTIPFGTAREHTGSFGTVSLAPKTLYDLIHDVIRSLHQTGFERFAVVTSHGGNWVLKPAIRELNQMQPRLNIALADPYRIAAAQLKGVCPTADVELHGGEVETSVMLALDPDAVNMSLATDFVPEITAEYVDYATFPEVTRDGIWGRPTGATAEKGHRALQVMIDEVAAYCHRVFEYTESTRRAAGAAGG